MKHSDKNAVLPSGGAVRHIIFLNRPLGNMPNRDITV